MFEFHEKNEKFRVLRSYSEFLVRRDKTEIFVEGNSKLVKVITSYLSVITKLCILILCIIYNKLQ